MSGPLVELEGVSKSYPFFSLSDVRLSLHPGQIMGFVGPNGAGKSTTLRIVMGIVRQDRGEARVLGLPVLQRQAEVKRQVGYVSEDMSLYGSASLAWHMQMLASIYPQWDKSYAKTLLQRFNLRAHQRVRNLSHGERMKSLLLLALARRPRVLVLDEPTAGLDPVARQEVMRELMDVVSDENRGVIFSSQNTQDVEQISDQITFLDRGRIIESRDKETFVDRWRRLHIDVPSGTKLPSLEATIGVVSSGRTATVTTNGYTPELTAAYERSGVVVREVQRMTLEEIFVATVMSSRKEPATCTVP